MNIWRPTSKAENFKMIDSEQVCKGKVKRTVRIGDEKDPEFLNWQEFQKECTFCIMGNQRLIYEWSVCVVKKVWKKTIEKAKKLKNLEKDRFRKLENLRFINRPKPSDLLWTDWKYVKTIGGSYVSVATEWESRE